MVHLDRRGGRALPLLPRRRRALHGPGDLDGGAGRARLGHRAGLRRVHAVPRRARLHRHARSSAPTAGWTAASTGTASTRPRDQMIYGIVQGGVYEDLRDASAGDVAGSGRGRHRHRRLARAGQGADARGGGVVAAARCSATSQPRHLLGIGDVDDILHAAWSSGIDTFDCATPTRLAATARRSCPSPSAAGALDLRSPATRRAASRSPAAAPARPARDHTRAYLHYLLRRRADGAAPVTLHNLDLHGRLMAELRAAIAAGTLAETAATLLAGAARARPPTTRPARGPCPRRPRGRSSPLSAASGSTGTRRPPGADGIADSGARRRAGRGARPRSRARSPRPPRRERALRRRRGAPCGRCGRGRTRALREPAPATCALGHVRLTAEVGAADVDAVSRELRPQRVRQAPRRRPWPCCRARSSACGLPPPSRRCTAR